MIIRSQEEQQKTLFAIVKKLGEKSGNSFAITNRNNEILYVNDKLQDLTGFTEQYLYKLHYLKLIEKTKEKNELVRIDHRIKRGKVTRTNLVHKRKTGPSFYAEIESIPFTNEYDETELVLLFVRDITFTQLYDFMARIEQDMYIAIQ
ncbi:MAG: PAS domain-containing protein, partial [Lysinibacillus sp.]